jgi:hypothetical protein
MKTIETDDEIIAKHDTGLRHRAQIELTICHRLISDLKNAGYDVAVDDGEDTTRGSEQELITAIFAVDEVRLYTKKKGERNSCIYLVLGNDGHDVISDYGISLEPILGPINAWIDEKMDKGDF